jgi:hydrogenase large subunit
LIGFAQGHKLTQKWAGDALRRVSAISNKQVTPVMLHSTLSRGAARAIHASQLADLAGKHWDLLVKNVASADAKLFVQPQFGDKELHGAGSHGPYKASLLGNPVANAAQPLEVLRTVRSFDPCLACVIHTFDPEGKELILVP